MRKFFLILSVCFILLVAGCFLFLDGLLTLGLSRAGLADVQVHGTELGLDRIQIAAFAARFSTADQGMTRVQIRDIAIRFSLAELLKRGRLSQVDIREVAISRISGTGGNKNKKPLQLPRQLSLLPDELRRSIPVDRISIEQLHYPGLSGFLAHRGIGLQIDFSGTLIHAATEGQITDTGQLSLELDSPDAGHGSLTVMGRYKEEEILHLVLGLQPKEISGSLDMDLQPMADFVGSFLTNTAVPELDGRLTIRFTLALPTAGSTRFSLTAKGSKLIVPGTEIEEADLDLAGNWTENTLSLAPESQLQLTGLQHGQTGVKLLFLGLAGHVQKLNSGFIITFDQHRQLRIQELASKDMLLTELALEPEKGLQIRYQSRDSWSVADNSLRISPLQLRRDPHSLAPGTLLCSFTGLEKSGHGFAPSLSLNSPQFDATIGAAKNIYHTAWKNVKATVRIQDNQLRGTVQLAPARIPGRISIQFRHDPVQGKGSFSLHTDQKINLSREGDNLAGLLRDWPFPFDLDQGTISLKADGSWAVGSRFRLATDLNVSGAGGSMAHLLFQGLNMKQKTGLLPILRSKGTFSLDELIGGVDAHDLKGNLQLLPVKKASLPLVRLNSFQATLFDGTVLVPEMSYDLNRQDSLFTVQINGLDPAIMLAMIKMNDLTVSGRISGTIPVRIRNRQVSVDQGSLHNEPPGGIIRYTPKGMNSSGITGYALKAVENFHYNSLQSLVRYAPDGQLDLDISLKGTSPGLETSRPVHFNIHAEQNLLDLLRSLRFSKGLTMKLDKKIKERYK